MRRHDQAIDLLVAVIGKGKHRPIGSGFARMNLDSTSYAIRAWRDRDLNAVAVGVLELHRTRQINGGRVQTDIDRLDCACTRDPDQGHKR